MSDLKERDPATVTTESPRQVQTEKPVNDIVKVAAQAKEGEEAAAQKQDDNRNTWIAAGVGVGVGSAALVAALLYANKNKKKTSAATPSAPPLDETASDAT